MLSRLLTSSGWSAFVVVAVSVAGAIVAGGDATGVLVGALSLGLAVFAGSPFGLLIGFGILATTLGVADAPVIAFGLLGCAYFVSIVLVDLDANLRRSGRIESGTRRHIQARVLQVLVGSVVTVGAALIVEALIDPHGSIVIVALLLMGGAAAMTAWPVSRRAAVDGSKWSAGTSH